MNDRPAVRPKGTYRNEGKRNEDVENSNVPFPINTLANCKMLAFLGRLLSPAIAAARASAAEWSIECAADASRFWQKFLAPYRGYCGRIAADRLLARRPDHRRTRRLPACRRGSSLRKYLRINRPYLSGARMHASLQYHCGCVAVNAKAIRPRQSATNSEKLLMRTCFIGHFHRSARAA